MLIALNFHVENAAENAADYVSDLNNAIENLVPVDETTSMHIENVALVSNDFADIMRAMSPEQRNAIRAQIVCAIETCADDADLHDTIDGLFRV